MSDDLASIKRQLRVQLQRNLQQHLSSDSEITVQCCATPKVSIIIVIWNQAELTLECLRRISEQRYTAYEVIIVDNASTDDTSRLLSKVSGAVVLRNETNIGFLRAVNLALQRCRGEYTLLLNNDAFVDDCAIERAAESLDLDASHGAVGGRLIWPNGHLQEAGSAIWSDGTCHGYLRDAPMDASEAQFDRYVDYCSGAFLMVRTALFRELRGFDVVYEPAYYEEADLCVRIWQAGFKVLYNAGVCVTHVEFGSSTSAADTSAQLQKNKKVFCAKNAAFLASQPVLGRDEMLVARMRPHDSARFLLVYGRHAANQQDNLDPLKEFLVKEIRRGHFATVYLKNQDQVNRTKVRNELPKQTELIFNEAGPGMESLGLWNFLMKRRAYYDAVYVTNWADVFVVDPALTTDLRTKVPIIMRSDLMSRRP